MFDTKHDPAWAWQPYAPTAENPWDLRKVGHLHRRAGFGANWAELQQGLKDGPAASIDKLLKPGPGLESHDKQLQEMAKHVVNQGADVQLRSWWLFRMLTTPFPLREKITLC